MNKEGVLYRDCSPLIRLFTCRRRRRQRINGTHVSKEKREGEEEIVRKWIGKKGNSQLGCKSRVMCFCSTDPDLHQRM